MVLIDLPMPESCSKCRISGQSRECLVTGKSYNAGLPGRPFDCPLTEAEEKEIRERISHTGWISRTVYAKKEGKHDR